MEKRIRDSKTSWFALAVALIPILQWTIDYNILAEYPQIVSGIGVAIFVLRKLTDQPMAMKF